MEFRSLDRGTSLRELMRRWAKTMGQCFVRLGEEQNSKDFSSQPTHDFPETKHTLYSSRRCVSRTHLRSFLYYRCVATNMRVKTLSVSSAVFVEVHRCSPTTPTLFILRPNRASDMGVLPKNWATVVVGQYQMQERLCFSHRFVVCVET